jgi:HAE1 family hydrophobic/amphiphilic exporter-1
MGLATDDNVAVEVRGHDLAAADVLAKQVAEIMRKVNGATDVRVSRELSSLEELILVDRAKAADMKLTILQVANSLQTILGGTQAGYFRDQGTESRIMVRLKDSERQQLADVMDLKLTNADDRQVSLRNVVKVESRHGPMNIQRKDQERIVVVSGNFSGRDTGSVLADLGRDLKSVPLPRDFSIDFGGDYDEQQKAFRELLVSLILSLVLVYMVMACQYESLRDPFVVMFSVPLAAIGVILILFFTDTTFNIQSYIGCIMLGGIVVNNAILLVDHTNLLRRRDGMGLRAAIEEAGRRRLRPILMTALTTILGLLPLAIGLGEGGEAQAPLARAVIGGLTSSTLITLVLVPVIYSMVERKEKMGGGPRGAPGGEKA